MPCSICNKIDNNPVDYGEFMQKSDIYVHYYCLLLSTHLPQNGKDNSGILGFYLRDIRNEIEKCKERTCCYCKEPNASIACFKCKIYFHNVCGNSNDCVSEFSDDFRSYCHQHVPFRREAFLKKSKPQCWICFDTLGEYNPVQMLKANCCKNGYVHRHCLRSHALSAGYQLKCIWCHNEDFRNQIRKFGVFVPDREPIWDNNETLRYVDLHRGYSRCDAKNCVCPNGREYFTKSKWKLMICCSCGSSGVHGVCGGKEITSKNQYTCETCRQVLENYAHADATTKNKKNNSMFISKTFVDRPDLLQVVNNLGPIDEDISDVDEFSKSKRQTIEFSEKKDSSKAPNELSNSKGQDQQPEIHALKETSSVSQIQSNLRQMCLVSKDMDIIGTVLVPKDKIRGDSSSGRRICSENDIVDFSVTNPLIEGIFDEIASEGRELSTDMVDEVFDRLVIWLEATEVESSDEE